MSKKGLRLLCLLTGTLLLAPGTQAQGKNQKHAGAKRAGKVETVSETPETQKVQAEELNAGPIHLKFCDGEIRYLYVGEREIARRIYFAVRDNNWKTAMPKFSKMTVHKQANAFTIDLQADCVTDTADYHWKGQMKGTADGVIKFTAAGEAGKDFGSNRIGICLLYGTPALLKQNFQTVDAAGAAAKGTFPEEVSPKLVAAKFQTLRYTADGMTVAASMTGATFDMEDQRNYGDSSYKAYAPLPYAYPQILKGDPKTQTLTLRVEHAPAAKTASKTTRLTLGALLPNVKIPLLLTAAPDAPDSIFGDINFNRDNFRDKKMLTWGLNPSVHLPDNDNFMDNATTIAEQARTTDVFATESAHHVTPIRLDSASGQRAGRDPRSASVFGSAWAARVVKYLSYAGVEDAGFDFGPGNATDALAELQPFAGHALYDVKIHAAGYASLDALAFVGNSGLQFWIINKTNQPQSVTVDNLPKTRCQLCRRDGSVPFGNPLTTDPVSGMTGSITTDLGPYEICEIQF